MAVKLLRPATHCNRGTPSGADRWCPVRCLCRPDRCRLAPTDLAPAKQRELAF